MNESQVKALLRPAAFAHEVRELEYLATHISWVVLTGDYAYKIKRPVDLGFANFSTLELRKHFCEEELRLNRRFAPDLYLDLARITAEPDGPGIDGIGETIDYAVKMRQFSQRALASVAADEGRLTYENCRKLGSKIGAFHNALVPLRLDPEEGEQPGTPEAIGKAARENFDYLDRTLPAREDRSVLRRLEHTSAALYQQLAGRMRERLQAGFVRECHGDLHLRNIVFQDGEPVPFDCIEFNEAFRLLDIQCEIGFLVMDIESRSLPGHANRVLNYWLETTGDYRGLVLQNFFNSYLAMVRAKVAVMAGGADSLGDPTLEEYRRYLALASAEQRKSPGFLCLTLGISGSGKSTVAESIAGEFSAIRLRSDVERKRLAGLAPEADSAATGVRDTLYSEAMSDRVFEHLLALAHELIDDGLPVIVDATFLQRARRAPFMDLAKTTGVPFLIVHCQASDAELERRILARERHGHDASEAGVEVMRAQKQKLQLPEGDESFYAIDVDTQAAGHLVDLANQIERQITSTHSSHSAQ